MSNVTPVKEIELFQRDDTQNMDKKYNLQILPDPSGSGLVGLYYRNGKRLETYPALKQIGGMMPLDKAEKEFDKKANGKKKDGYTEQEGGEAYQGTEIGARHTGFKPQLLLQPKGSVADNIEKYLAQPGWIWEQKMDGERRPIQKHADGSVTGMQRDGLAVPLPMTLVEAVRALPIESCIIDGEDMPGGRWAPFDLPSTPADPTGQRPYKERKAELLALLSAAPSPIFIKIRSADNPKDARALHALVSETRGEGLVAKRADASYSAGRGEDQLKFPYKQRATLLVIDQPRTKRSIGVGSVNPDGSVRDLGRVTVPPNKAVPANGTCVDIECLYLNPNGGGLHIPTFISERTDQCRENCTIDQLHEPSKEEWASIIADHAAQTEQDIDTEEMSESGPGYR